MYKLLVIEVMTLWFLTFGSLVAQVKEVRIICKEEGYESAYPRLSKDNSKILYQSNKTGKWQLMIMNIDSKENTVLLNDTNNNNFPDWSVDNKWVAFVSDRNGNEEIYLMDLKHKDPKNISNSKARDIHPYFSPDGKFILFNSDRDNGSFDIYRYEIATGKTTRLTNTVEDETCARYSPDMKSIVYLKNGNSYDDVFLLSTSTFVSENITHTPKVRDGWPMFGPDGKWIYYSSMETGVYNIYRIKPDGTEKKQITEASWNEEDARVNISNDNSIFIYNKRKGKTIEILLAPLPK
jgi:tol-pal system beta propeller repeat protein TolB